MATLVLSTVGTALGGPVGSAIGALIGQSIDQELLAPVSRGPRVGDLTVQSSSYGTQIPRVYGTMRVAGSVVWSTDLVEHSQSGGAKGQPDVTYAYTVSFAVALSSRRASSIGRIWADGNLLRGAAGDLKVGGTLRFHDGSENQVVDPLIGSVESIANTPAYRGLALAVFEDLELATFGNRIPFLTFELVADEAPVAVGAVLADASAGAISAASDDKMLGYAAYGRSIRDAVQPIVDAYAVELFDDGHCLRTSSNGAPVAVGSEEFGNSADHEQSARLERKQSSPHSLPAALRLAYYDPARDYQSAEARAAASDQKGVEVKQDLAATLDAGSAKTLAQSVIARSWAARDQLTLRLPPSRLTLEPGSVLRLELSPALWVIDQLTVDGFVVIADLHPCTGTAAPVAAEAGRVAQNPDEVVGPITVALIDVPNVLGPGLQAPTLLLAASDASARWKARPVQIQLPGQTIASQTAGMKSVLGSALSMLGAGSTELFDDWNSLDVMLIDEEQWLTSCDDERLAGGSNLAMLGSELLQFGRVAPLGGGRFRLSHLLRGRGGTEWACGAHGIGEPFCLVEAGRLQAVTLPPWCIGATIGASAVSSGSVSTEFKGECVRPLSPVGFGAALQPDGSLALSWTRRSRQGFAWLDEIDAPIGESLERYSVVLSGTAGSLDITCDRTSIAVGADELAALGAGPASIAVRQVGDFGMSRPAQASITLA